MVLITGANRGLGLELARQYGAAGSRVIACCRHPQAVAAPGLPGDIAWRQLDVADGASIAALAATMEGDAIDILINNAALRGDTGGLPGLTAEDFLAVMQVNALGPLLMVKAFLPHVQRGHRRIVANISSRVATVAGLDADGDYAYRCSKAALNIATAKLAFDHHLIFLALHPGWVKTDMGGVAAEVPIAVSAAGLRAVIAAAGPGDSGSFRSFDGSTMAW